MICGHKTITKPNPFPWGLVLWFPKTKKEHTRKFKNLGGLARTKFNIVWQTTLFCWSLWT
jgi:hypothetical protein